MFGYHNCKYTPQSTQLMEDAGWVNLRSYKIVPKHFFSVFIFMSHAVVDWWDIMFQGCPSIRRSICHDGVPLHARHISIELRYWQENLAAMMPMCFSPSILTLTLNLPFPNVIKYFDFFQQYAIYGYHFVLSVSHRTITIERWTGLIVLYRQNLVLYVSIFFSKIAGQTEEKTAHPFE